MGLLNWALVALVVSVFTGAFSINDVTHGVATTAKVLYGVFLMAAAILFFMATMDISFLVWH
jgi:uncharacterized membrane protein YtjA (UPF0391 family)